MPEVNRYSKNPSVTVEGGGGARTQQLLEPKWHRMPAQALDDMSRCDDSSCAMMCMNDVMHIDNDTDGMHVTTIHICAHPPSGSHTSPPTVTYTKLVNPQQWVEGFSFHTRPPGPNDGCDDM